MIDISQSMGGQPGIFLRYNPDKYKSTGANVGDMDRLRTLLEIIKQLGNQPCEEFLQVGYLYYDNHEHFHLETLVPFATDGDHRKD